MKINGKLTKIIGTILTISSLAFTSSCGNNPKIKTNKSTISTVNLPQTPVKRQSIGNCWVYGFIGWLESLALKASPDEPLNLSESYMTYRHFEQQLLRYQLPQKIATGGGFNLAILLIKKYGVIKEGDFIPAEADEIRSNAQLRAEFLINESLTSGELAKLRTASELSQAARKKIIHQELNKAFDVNPENFSSKIINPRDIIVEKSETGRVVTLEQLINNPNFRWQSHPFPSDLSRPLSREELPAKTLRPTLGQTNLLRRVFRAMNDGHPVIISWFVDFNANEGELFAYDILKENGSGRQGYHMTVLEDYTVTGINPASGEIFSIGEGEISETEKNLAMKYGNLNYFVIKNSWGVSQTSTYFRDGTYGYHKLNSDYLLAWLEEKDEETSEYKKMTYTLNEVVLPPGY